ARRTVAKYRDIGGIPPKGQRKRALLREREEVKKGGAPAAKRKAAPVPVAALAGRLDGNGPPAAVDGHPELDVPLAPLTPETTPRLAELSAE
ncbi:MAG TPA: hypothetical protein VEI97_02155, partial [bacterium]|nr:hypothetical protein [bacterium]